MITLTVERESLSILKVNFSEDTISVDLSDGRTIAVPIAWFPRLMNATPKERQHWRFIGRGDGIHWKDIDEDISIENFITGQASNESQSSFKKWFEKRHRPTRR